MFENIVCLRFVYHNCNITHFNRQRQNNAIPEEYREKYGIPQHFGLFYAMGWALCVEGVMSASYHVCPSYNNFQFGKCMLAGT